MITKPVLTDTGPLVAILSEDDGQHDRCLQQSRLLRRPAYTCWPAVTEAAYLLRNVPGGVRRLLAARDGTDFEILPLTVADFPGIKGILGTYADQGFDLADAALMYLAERENIDHVFTLDRRHFSVYVKKDTKPLLLIPV